MASASSSTVKQPSANAIIESFNVYTSNVTSALETASKIATADHNALAQMNRSATVFYKMLRTRLNSVAIQTNAIQHRSTETIPSHDHVDALWERTLRLEAVVVALNNYSARLESELLDTDN